jgi:hypothetical protein
VHAQASVQVVEFEVERERMHGQHAVCVQRWGEKERAEEQAAAAAATRALSCAQRAEHMHQERQQENKARLSVFHAAMHRETEARRRDDAKKAVARRRAAVAAAEATRPRVLLRADTYAQKMAEVQQRVCAAAEERHERETRLERIRSLVRCLVHSLVP